MGSLTGLDSLRLGGLSDKAGVSVRESSSLTRLDGLREEGISDMLGGLW